MRMVGHKTESIYRRYRIVDEQDLRDAAARLDTVVLAADKKACDRQVGHRQVGWALLAHSAHLLPDYVFGGAGGGMSLLKISRASRHCPLEPRFKMTTYFPLSVVGWPVFGVMDI